MGESGERVTVGVEEEFHIVDRHTRRLAPYAHALLDRLPDDAFGAELQRCVVEANSQPWPRLAELAADVAASRRALVKTAREQGLGVVAAGTVPLVDPTVLGITADRRYENMLDEYQLLAREQLICGTQVHVNVGDRDLAVAVVHRIAPWLPTLTALSASSPYWLGNDSGYASWRTFVWQRWPTVGPVQPFSSAAEYDRLVDDLIRTGVISDRGMIYFDARPSAHLPTVELRVCDACPRVDDVVLLAGLFRALVVRESAAAAANRPALPVRNELVRAATWRAARSGLEGVLVDPVDIAPAPASRVVERLLRTLRPTLEAMGDWETVTELSRASLERGSAAARQRAAFARDGRLEDVVDLLLAETRLGCD